MLDLVIDARRVHIGDLEVGRVLPFMRRRMVGPFIFLDHACPVDLPPSVPATKDVRPHPHIGLSTVTYMFDGEITHRDSLGIEQVIRPGEVNWMTAGRGISHSERFEGSFRRDGGRLELLQAWVALPEADEEADPDFHHYGLDELPTWKDKGLWARLIAGAAFGLSNSVRTSSPLFYIHAELQSGGRLRAPTEYSEGAAYVRNGRVEIDGREYHKGQMMVFSAGAAPTITAVAPSTVMLLGGEPLGRRQIWWNFVSSRKERTEQAKADWKAGRIALPPHDNREFIPLPDEPPPPPEPLS